MLYPPHIVTNCAIFNSEETGIVFSHDKEQAVDRHNKMDEPLKYAKQNKPDKIQ